MALIFKLLLIIFLSYQALSAKLITINFQKLTVSELITITSKVINKNILLTQPIEGKVGFVGTKKVNEEELLKILDAVLLVKGFVLHKKDSFYTIVKHNKEHIMEVVNLQNIEAKELVSVLKKSLPSSSKTELSALEDLNSLILAGTQTDINYLKLMIQKLDKNKSQVYVKAKIIEVNNHKVNQIGIEYGILQGSSSNGKIVTFSSKLNSLQQHALSFPLSNLGLPVASVNSALALGASINFLKQKRALDIVSEPSILCLNNKTSSIYVGEKKSIKIATTTSDTGNIKDTFNREDTGLILKVTPRIANNKKVSLNLHAVLENFSQTSSTNEQPDTFKKEIKTTAILNSGESVILGGLIENKKEKMNDDIPVLSQIPLFGNLFKNSQDVTIKKNLVIIVTPYIIPKTKDLTYLRQQLAELTLLEERYLEQTLQQINKKRIVEQKSQEEKLKEALHKKRMKEYFGI